MNTTEPKKGLNMNGPSTMRIGRLAGLVMLAVGSLAGCADEATDDTVTQTTSALTTIDLKLGKYTLHNYQTGLCLGVAAGTPTLNTPLVVWTCDQSANQNWQAQAVPGNTGEIELKNFVAADRCMNLVGNPYTSNGTPIGINTCSATDFNETTLVDSFRASYVGNDLSGKECYNFADEEGFVVGVSGGKTGKGQPIILWSNFHDPYNHPDQIWCMYPPAGT